MVKLTAPELFTLPPQSPQSAVAAYRGGPVRGYAAPPGSGPSDQTCKTCEHYCRVRYHDKVWLKCALLKPRWTHGPGTDIKASAPACSKWHAA